MHLTGEQLNHFMRTILNTLAAGLLLGFLASSPLLAQDALPVEANTNQTGGYSEAFQVQKLELEQQMQKDRLQTEKDMASSKYDSQHSMVHDLAWNSWILCIIGILIFDYLKDKRRHETIRLMVEKGTPLTPEILASIQKNRGRLSVRTPYDRHCYLRWGVTLVAVGIGLTFFAPKAAWIVLAIGIAHLILWFVDRSHPNDDKTK
jgi:Domain of unknown function (DUF6249)